MDSQYLELQRAAQDDNVQSTVVGLIICEKREVLLLKRRADDFMPHLWEIPGGHVDAGETLPMALSRELEEETGWRLERIVQYLGSYDYAGEFGRTRQWNFEVHARGQSVVHPEHVAHCWAAPDEWRRLPMTREMRSTLDAFAAERNLASDS